MASRFLSRQAARCRCSGRTCPTPRSAAARGGRGWRGSSPERRGSAPDPPRVEEFDYSNIDSLQHFKGTHPKVMQARIEKMNWKFSFAPTQKKLSFKQKILNFIETTFGWRIGEYKNYKIV